MTTVTPDGDPLAVDGAHGNATFGQLRAEARRSRFTVYVDLLAGDVDAAQALVAGPAKGLGALCAEVDTFSAVWSPAGLVERVEPVFAVRSGQTVECAAICTDMRGCTAAPWVGYPRGIRRSRRRALMR
jgi:hypothetical protein